MKSSSTLQALFAAFFVLTAALINHANAGQRTATVMYKNQRIPAVSLQEVEITSDRSPVLCEMIKYEGEFIPSVEMNEVTISGSGENHQGNKGYIKPEMKGTMTSAVLYNGNYIPEVDGPEVTIEADSSEQVAEQMNELDAGQERKSFLKVNARQTFDRLGVFFFEQSRRLIRRMLPSGI